MEQPRFDFERWKALYQRNIDDASWPVRRPVESPMDIIKRELWIQRNAPLKEGVPVDYFVFGLGDPPHPACTKFGGAPYRSRSIAWPKTGNGGNCEFIAQINFSQSRDLSSRLPSDLLLIFLTSEDGALLC